MPRTYHEVERGSNLDFLLRASIGAFNRFTDTVGKGMTAIALALSTPNDNSAEVQKQIDEFVKQLKSSSDNVEDAIKQQSEGG